MLFQKSFIRIKKKKENQRKVFNNGIRSLESQSCHQRAKLNLKTFLLLMTKAVKQWLEFGPIIKFTRPKVTPTWNF